MLSKDDDVTYEMKSVRALRPRAATTRRRLEEQGWEFVSEDSGLARTELHFRRVTPKASKINIALTAGAIGLAVIIVSVGAALEDTEETTPTANTPSVVATPTPTEPPTTEEPAPEPIEISPEELFDNISADDTEVGQLYLVTGSLASRDVWQVGSTGNYEVLMSAHGGDELLPVLVDRDTASDWVDGSKVELVVELVERSDTSGPLAHALKVQSARLLSTPTSTPTPKPKPKPKRTPAPKPTKSVTIPAPAPVPVPAYYANCTEARAAGAAPVYAGDPGYGTHLDRDRDGVACE